jgi:hypothetical protein
VTADRFIETSPTERIIDRFVRGLEAQPMQKKHYAFALIAVAGAVWIYAVGQSTGELLGLIRAAPTRPAASVEAPSEPLAVRPSQREQERAPAAPTVAAGEGLPGLAPARVAPRPTEPEPAAYPDAGYASGRDDTEVIDDHPGVTDPVLRKRLQPAWDD